LQSFSVDAITHCEKLDKPAKEINQKAIQEQMQSGYGIFGGEARYWAKLKFTPERARWVQTEEWHPDQKSTLHPDGSYTLEVPYSDARELLGDVMRFGADVEVLAPKSLRESAMASFSKALDQYKL